MCEWHHMRAEACGASLDPVVPHVNMPAKSWGCQDALTRMPPSEQHYCATRESPIGAHPKKSAHPQAVDRDAVTAAIAGAKMAGFEVTGQHRRQLEAFARGEFTVEEYVEQVRAKNRSTAKER